jgi:hypothetical protein
MGSDVMEELDQLTVSKWTPDEMEIRIKESDLKGSRWLVIDGIEWDFVSIKEEMWMVASRGSPTHGREKSYTCVIRRHVQCMIEEFT